MKEDGISKTPIREYRKSKQYQQSSQRLMAGLESFESQRLEDAMQSSIAQEQFICSQLKRNDELKKKNFRLTDSSNHLKQPSENFLNKFNRDISYGNSRLLLGESISKRTQIVTIKQIKRYEQKAKSRVQGYKFPDKLDFSLKVNEGSGIKNDKSTKKSLSSSKIARQKAQSIEQKQKSINNNRNEVQNNFKENRNSLDLQSIKSYNESSLSKSLSSKNIITNVGSCSLYPIGVPFSFQNINTTINNLQNLDIQSNHSRSESQESKPNERKAGNEPNQRTNLKKKNRQNKLLKQLNSTKYLIDVPLDINKFSYQLDMEVSIQKNRGFQVYLISPEKRSDGVYFEDVMHFKYEIVKLPPNMLRLRVYLLVEARQNVNSNRKKQQSQQKAEQIVSSRVDQSVDRQWKVWKEIQVPIVNNGQKLQNDLSKKIKVSILNVELNWVSIKINSSMEFNLRLHHQELPTSYYCIDQDFNGVELVKLGLSGKEKFKTTEDLIGEGCQGKCQLI